MKRKTNAQIINYTCCDSGICLDNLGNTKGVAMKKVKLTLEITEENEMDARIITTEGIILPPLEDSEEAETEMICMGIYKLTSRYFKESRERYGKLRSEKHEKQIDWRRDN